MVLHAAIVFVMHQQQQCFQGPSWAHAPARSADVLIVWEARGYWRDSLIK
jgi:hypothetical protein